MNIESRFYTTRYNKPTKLFVHASPGFDPFKIAGNGIYKTSYIMPHSFNVLEIIPNGGKSYTGIHELNTIQGDAFIFDAETINKNRIYFSGVNDFSLMGGAFQRCLTTTFISVLALKTCHVNKKVIELFKGKENLYFGDKKLYEKAKDELRKIQGLGLINERSVNFNFIAEAIYPDYQDLTLNSDDNGEIISVKLSDWQLVKSCFPQYQDMISEYLFRFMPGYHRKLLDGLGFEIVEYMDGIKFHKYPGKDEKNPYRINLRYWSSSEKFDQFFRQRLEK